MATKAQCTATTKAGKPCTANPIKGTDRCLAHSPAKVRESAGFIADNGKAGRPKTPRAVDVLRERLEERIDEVLDPLFDALTADGGLVVGNGSDAYVEMMPDHRTRITAVRELLDRAYGKAKQVSEITGPDGGPVVLEAPLDAAAKSARAAALLRQHGHLDADA